MFEIFARCKDFQQLRPFHFGSSYSRATAIFPNRSDERTEPPAPLRLRGLRRLRVLRVAFEVALSQCLCGSVVNILLVVAMPLSVS